jgi:UDP-N-acetylglucosamine 2-epimerase (non-hydrolysing)
MKLAIIIGTRPEIIRLSMTIKLAKKYFDTFLIHTGQNYDSNLNDIFFTDLELSSPDYYLDCSRKNIGSTVGDIISKSYDLFLEIKPDAILILGDTNSCLCAYSAKRLKIPIFHVEAGNRCFDPNVPEEINRRLIDHIADINMCYMEHARKNLLYEGLKTQYTFVIGSPMTEVLNNISHKIQSSTILEKLSLQPKQYFLLSFHREENVNNDKNFSSIIDSINQIDNIYHKKIVISIHPRTKKILNEKNIIFSDNIILSEPFGILDYCKLQTNSYCVISDSGTLTEESSILKFPAVLLRTSTEHPEGIDSGNIILGDIKWNNLKINIDMALEKNQWNILSEYVDINVSQKICNIISGYTGIVNKFLWMK